MRKEGHKTPEEWMRHCLHLAREAQAQGDAPVGSVVTTGEGEWVAEGREAVAARQDVTAHAETEAIRAACRALGRMNLSGCVLYTTTEPCFLCAYAIRETGLSRVVIGTWIEDIGGVTSRHPILTDPHINGWAQPPDIVPGVLEQECRALSETNE